MRRRQWWAWPAECAVVGTGALAAVGLIVGLGWGQHGGWRLLAAAAAGLAVAAVMSELPVARVREQHAVVPANTRRFVDSPDSGDC
jgi:hypothetical protein